MACTVATRGRTSTPNAVANTVSVIGVPVSVGSTTVGTGGSVSVTWSNLFGPSGSDFVGLFKVGASNGSAESVRFTNGTASPGGAGQAAGSVDLPIPAGLASGDYEVRLVAGPSNGTLGRVSVTVANAPVAVNDTYFAAAERTLTVPAPGVLGNDSDADSPTLQAAVVTGPAHGSLSLQANGAFTYTPSASYTGPDRFTYRVTDQAGLSSTGAVSITVNQVACGPRPNVRLQSAVAAGALQVTVTADGADGPTENRLQELRFGAPTNGRVVLDGQTRTDPFAFTVPSPTDRVTFAVQRVTPGQATTVPLTVVDRCGSWQTLVGGGNCAGF